MRKRSGNRGLFQYRDQWIDEEKGRAGFYRHWYDDESRRVKRKALSAVTLEEAQDELIEILGAPTPSSSSPSEVYLFDVLRHYKDNYAEPKGYKQMAAVRRAAEL